MDPLAVWEQLDPSGPPEVVWVVPAAGDEVVVLLGAFDPPTNAHLELTAGAARLTGRAGALCITKDLLDRPGDVLLSAEERVGLLHDLASSEGLGLALSNRGTYLEVARAMQLDAWFAVGSDKLSQLEDPRFYPDGSAGVEATFAEVHLVVVPRCDRQVHRDVEILDPDRIFSGPHTASLSASDVRRRLAAGMSVSDSVPSSVAHRLERYTQGPSRHR